MIKDKKNKPNAISRFFDDSVLLKLYRNYGQHEAVKHLFEEISKLRFSVGELKSENAELLHQNNIVKGVKQWSKDEYVRELKSIIKTKVKAKSKAEQKVVEWRNKYFNLLAKHFDLFGLIEAGLALDKTTILI